MTVVRAKVSQSGRLSIPAKLRRAIGLKHGGDVTMTEAVAQALSRRLLGERLADASVDNFLAERK